MTSSRGTLSGVTRRLFLVARLMNRRILQYGVWLAGKKRAHDMPVVEALPFESLLNRVRAALVSH